MILTIPLQRQAPRICPNSNTYLPDLLSRISLHYMTTALLHQLPPPGSHPRVISSYVQLDPCRRPAFQLLIDFQGCSLSSCCSDVSVAEGAGTIVVILRGTRLTRSYVVICPITRLRPWQGSRLLLAQHWLLNPVLTTKSSSLCYRTGHSLALVEDGDYNP